MNTPSATQTSEGEGRSAHRSFVDSSCWSEFSWSAVFSGGSCTRAAVQRKWIPLSRLNKCYCSLFFPALISSRRRSTGSRTQQVTDFSVGLFKNGETHIQHVHEASNNDSAVFDYKSRCWLLPLLNHYRFCPLQGQTCSWQIKVIVNEVCNQLSTLLALLMTVRKIAWEVNNVQVITTASLYRRVLCFQSQTTTNKLAMDATSSQWHSVQKFTFVPAETLSMLDRA